MLDFLQVSVQPKGKSWVVTPTFKITKTTDLMIRGGDFYAIWIEELGLWSTDEQDAVDLIDREIRKVYEENKSAYGEHNLSAKYLYDSSSGSIDAWHKYCQKQCRDSYVMLDENLIFSNTKTTKKDYASKRLNYPLEQGPCPAWDKLVSTLYSPEERHKIEWAIGAIVSGESKTLQKFMVLYGSAGTGKSTILNIIQQLFEGYYSVFDAKALGTSSNVFALEAFKKNPLVAIQHDGDLSRIEDNTRLNSLVSHEIMTVNEKFKSTYDNSFKCFLIMGTNTPVKITDSKSGLLRRLIDVSPSGRKVPQNEYKQLTKQVSFELGAIAYRCKEIFLDDPDFYDDYIPTGMIGASNDFYNYVVSCYSTFLRQDGTTLRAAWSLYNEYIEDARVPYPMSQRAFKEELKNYFWEFIETFDRADGKVDVEFKGFRVDKFEKDMKKKPGNKNSKNKVSWIEFKEQKSILDDMFKDCLAQYASDNETPSYKWEKVKSKLSDLDTTKLHYVKPPDESHIFIDFDLKDENGNKSFEKNLDAASKWPETYAELSKGGEGIHLHYIYTGDATKLSRIYDDDIEIKVCTGNSSIRRRLSKCNNLPVSTISSGLPLKGDTKMIDSNVVQSEKGLRTTIKKCLNKEVHPSTKSNVDYIYKLLEDYYNSGSHYDVSDLYNSVFAFAANSTNQADTCIKLVQQMHFKSEDASAAITDDDKPIAFYDIEVFPNLFLVNWKFEGLENKVVRMINPTPKEIENLLQYRLIGFNCRRYDNHLIYARLMGYTNEQLYNLSQKIISSQKGDKNNGLFGEAYNISYTDVYDFASAGNKKSLKKLEIEMSNAANNPHSKMDDNTRELCKRIKHHELGLPWDKPVPEELWEQVAEYCDDDVIATEAAYHYLTADWTARQILADLAGLSTNDTTNALTTRIIFGRNKKPQNEFHYRNLAEPVTELDEDTYEFLAEACPTMMSMTHGEAGSYLPYFPGYKYENGKSTYRGEEVGEGGYVYAEPNMYGNVALLDVASMHPHSTIAECLFGIRYTKAYRDIVEGRVSIKHEAWEIVNEMLDGKLKPYIQKVINGEMTSGDLANALKTAINSVYGLTSASFENPFRDIRNKDNIVAKRGALFMIDLKNEVQKRGFTVAHIKTDSIKIPDATPEIIQFVMEFGEKYGYTFEHEATYDKMCIVNNAVYIAKYATPEKCQKIYGYVPSDNKKHVDDPWTATGAQFAVPYVFKKLFSKAEITFEDMCETFSVSKGDLYLDMNEELSDVSDYEKQLDKYETQLKKGQISDIEFAEMTSDLVSEIATGHDYHFVGRVGQFCPIKPGYGGGVLYRMNEGKPYAASGTTGYRWLESEKVKTLGKEDCIDRSFYEKLVNDAVDTISKYGDFEYFTSDDPYIKSYSWMMIPDDVPDEIAFV